MDERSRAKSWFHNLKINRCLALAGIIAPILSCALSNAATILYPGYNPLRQTVSKLALGPNGWIQTINFFVVGSLIIVFVTVLRSGINKRRGFRGGIGILFFVGCGTLLLGLFPAESFGIPMISNITVHLVIAAAVIELFPIACLLLAPSLKVDPQWRGLFVYTVVTGIIGLSLAISIFGLPNDFAFLGLYERLLLTIYGIWMAVMGIRLWRLYRFQSQKA